MWFAPRPCQLINNTEDERLHAHNEAEDGLGALVASLIITISRHRSCLGRARVKSCRGGGGGVWSLEPGSPHGPRLNFSPAAGCWWLAWALLVPLNCGGWVTACRSSLPVLELAAQCAAYFYSELRHSLITQQTSRQSYYGVEQDCDKQHCQCIEVRKKWRFILYLIHGSYLL